MKRAIVLLAIISALVLAGCSVDEPAPPQSEQAVIRVISAEEAHGMMVSNETIILDVRTKEEYDERHIVNAKLLPLDDIDSESALEVAPNMDEPVLVYCRSGRRSAEAAQILASLGYKQVYDFGGIIDWPYDVITSDEPANPTALSEEQLPIGVKIVCGNTRSLSESE